MDRRGAGSRAEMDMEAEVFVEEEDYKEERTVVIRGVFCKATVEGLMSWVGDGRRFREAD